MSVYSVMISEVTLNVSKVLDNTALKLRNKKKKRKERYYINQTLLTQQKLIFSFKCQRNKQISSIKHECDYANAFPLRLSAVLCKPL